MKNLRKRVFGNIIKYVDFYFISSIPLVLIAGFILHVCCIDKFIAGKPPFVNFNIALCFFCVAFACFVLTALVKDKIVVMAKYLQDTNINLSDKDFNAICCSVSELDIETFTLLERKALKYEKEQKEIERSKRKFEREVEYVNELKEAIREGVKERQKILGIKKAIQESLRE